MPARLPDPNPASLVCSVALPQKANCQSCSEDASRCDSCAEGYHWDESAAECLACGVADCAYCETADTCLSCKAGFGLPAPGGNSCVGELQAGREQCGCLR